MGSTYGILARPLPDRIPFTTKPATCPGAIEQGKCRVVEQPLIPYTSLLKLQHIAKNPRQWKTAMALSGETHFSTTTTNLHPNGKQGQVFTQHQNLKSNEGAQSQKTPDFQRPVVQFTASLDSLPQLAPTAKAGLCNNNQYHLTQGYTTLKS